MIRTTLLGLAAAAALLGASATTASAGVTINLGYGHYGYANPYYGGYQAPPPYYGGGYCKRVFVGYKRVWNGYGYYKKPIYKKRCY
ncbi:MAG: hypothetical protein AB7S41_08280 [Parvibaculaceae bacterium]